MRNKQKEESLGISRRALVQLGLLTVAACIIPVEALALISDSISVERSLLLFNLHTEESFEDIYWRKGQYMSAPLKRINYIFRDHYNGAIKPIDRRLIDLLAVLQVQLGSIEPLQIISGYRTKITNAYLRRNNKGVAKNSLHVTGQAADIRLPNRKLRDLKDAAYEIKGGGVGYYPKSNFVHIDVGKVRYW